MTIQRAPYAAVSAQSRGRLLAEPGSPTRSEFQRDRDRIIHSTAFRRLAHKSQVFVPHEGDHYRTRLTHTIEVAQIARALARALALDDDLAEAVALAHDLGHTPFGHTGEDVLDAAMQGFGGFDHNAQALRIVTKLERRYAGHDGLNLTWETLEGLVKHNGPLLRPDGAPTARYAKAGVPAAILEYDALMPLELATWSSAEAQAAAVADDIAYNAHDIDDGLRAGLFDVEDLREVDFLRDILDEIHALHPGLERVRVIHEITRRVITRLIEDVIVESGAQLAALAPSDAAQVRAAGRIVVGFSPAMAGVDKALKAFLFPHMYRHPRVMKVRGEAAGVVEVLFARFSADPALMPQEWADAAAGAETDARRMRLVCDYIAGMTDRYAVSEHRRLTGDAPTLR
ncbi:MAG: deoxyguanosinetriphosphate triphosphohydrolase [Hyphomicrobiales bacterium]|nr:deoxyguanosinetriphosphate triphosphohydrolase [Hyphomicrobiales bacterium]